MVEKVKDVYSLEMMVSPTFQVADQEENLPPRLLNCKDGTVFEEMVRQPLPFQQPYQPEHPV